MNEETKKVFAGKRESDPHKMSKINRLKRSPRPSQPQRRTQKPPNRVQEFKTPTHPARGRFRSFNTDESPNADSEFHHDIIWDQNSPTTPIRNGRRRTTNVKLVDISEIVNRIAPKSRRPEEAESTLLQWIGDSAIPCTPDVQEHRIKHKSARPNVVDDLLKLAKQFDFNMIQQDEAEKTTSNEVMDEDQELFYNENHQPTTQNGAETNGNDGDPMDDLALVQEMEDDLDLLFDSSTQPISGCLSQGWSGRSQGRPKLTQSTAAMNGNGSGTGENLVTGATNVLTITATLCNSNSRHHQSLASGTEPSAASAALSNSGQLCSVSDFDDDWNSDDLLDDSLVREMTQNPQLFSAPQHSSTQKRTNRSEGGSLTNHQQPSNDVQSGSSQWPNQKLRQAFQLDPQLSRQWKEASGRLHSNSNILGSGFPVDNVPSSKVAPVVPVSDLSNPDQWQCNVSKARDQTREPVQVERSSGKAVCGAPSVSSSTLDLSSLQLEKQNQLPTEEHGLADDDLDSIFASDDIWDDGADDDDMFCEVCEKVEEFGSELDPRLRSSVGKPIATNRGIQSRTFVSSMETGRNVTSNMPCPPNTGTSSAAGDHNGFITLPSQKSVLHRSSFKFSQTKNRRPGTGSGGVSAEAQQKLSQRSDVTSRQTFNQSTVPGDHQFKKPYSTFKAAPATAKDVSRCSDAEIEKKRQQAMERRRLRTTASQNLRPPT